MWHFPLLVLYVGSVFYHTFQITPLILYRYNRESEVNYITLKNFEENSLAYLKTHYEAWSGRVFVPNKLISLEVFERLG